MWDDTADIEQRKQARKEGAAAERASIVAWIRTDLIRNAGQNPHDAAVFRLVATMIERLEASPQPEPAQREDEE